MRRHLTCTMLAIFGFAYPIAAQEARKLNPYEIYDASLAALDKACIDQAIKVLSKAKGFTGLGYDSPIQWNSILNGIVFTHYRAAVFESDFGTVSGDIICVAAPSQNVIAELSFAFDSPGFAGLRTIPGRTPAESKINSFVSQNPTPIIGAN